jgi:hypothetical protein
LLGWGRDDGRAIPWSGLTLYKLHELLRAFAQHHSQMLNSSAVARALVTTQVQVGRYLRRLKGDGYLRLLPALPEPCPSDMIRKPRLYLRPRAWTLAFLRADSPEGCVRLPVFAELAARTTDGVIEHETNRSRRRKSEFHSMGRYRRRGVDLVVVRPSGRRIGLCFEPRPTDSRANLAIVALQEAVASRWIHTAILVTCEGLPRIVHGTVLCLPASLLLAMYSQWTGEATTREDIASLFSWLDRPE